MGGDEVKEKIPNSDEVKEKKENTFVEGFKDFCNFLYNSDEGTVLGRGGTSWGKIIVFYFFFYAFLAGFFSVCLICMLKTLDSEKPTVFGRTNKPVVAIGYKELYSINFHDGDEWTKYRESVTELAKAYAGNDDISNENATIFEFGEPTLGDCADTGNVAFSSQTACVYMALNRIYAYAPIEPDTDGELVFNCERDDGKAGDGIKEPPVVMTPQQPAHSLKQYYPWYSLTKNGLQPLHALKVVQTSDVPADKGNNMYIMCKAIIRKDGKDVPLPNARPALYSFKLKQADE